MLSTRLFWRSAAMVPSSIPNPKAIAIEMPLTTRVTGQARMITCVTVSVGLW